MLRYNDGAEGRPDGRGLGAGIVAGSKVLLTNTGGAVAVQASAVSTWSEHRWTERGWGEVIPILRAAVAILATLARLSSKRGTTSCVRRHRLTRLWRRAAVSMFLLAASSAVLRR
jgi:hypothetical protein